MQGWIQLHRKIQDNFLWRQPREFSRAEAWIDILMEVQHDKEVQKIMIKNEIITCGRGQAIKSLETWAMRWKWSKSAVRRFLILLCREGMLTIENVRKTTRLTVCNYNTYQEKRISSETQVKRKRNAGETQVKPDNNVNNDKNDNNDKYMDFVFLSKDEYSKLLERFGSIVLKEKISALNDYLGSTGKKYKSHYHTILSWARKDEGSTVAKKTRLFPISGRICGKPDCRLPAVYKNSSGDYDTYLCAKHLPEDVKECYE